MFITVCDDGQEEGMRDASSHGQRVSFLPALFPEGNMPLSALIPGQIFSKDLAPV